MLKKVEKNPKRSGKMPAFYCYSYSENVVQQCDPTSNILDIVPCSILYYIQYLNCKILHGGTLLLPWLTLVKIM